MPGPDELAQVRAMLVDEEAELAPEVERLTLRLARVRGAIDALDGKTPRPGRRPRARLDRERDAVLAVIEERPGVTVPEIAAVSKLSDKEVVAALGSLRSAGLVLPEGRGLKLAKRQAMTLGDL